jgi:AraC family transcriptional regulator
MMMDQGRRDRRYDSHAAFYADAYTSNVDAVHSVGRLGANVLSVSQDLGDWSDAPTPDLIVTKLESADVEASIDMGSGRFTGLMRRGSFVLTPPDSGTSIQVFHPHRLQILAVPYRRLLELVGTEEEDGLPRDGDFGGLHARSVTDGRVSAVLQCLWEEAITQKPYGALAADGSLIQLLAALLELRDQRRPELARGGLTPRQVRRVTDYLQAHLEEDVSLSELGLLVDLSPAYLCRAFKQSVGVPPHAWLLKHRVERAQELMLASPEMALTEVALSVGYSGQSAFGTAFRRVTGETPSGWKRERLA